MPEDAALCNFYVAHHRENETNLEPNLMLDGCRKLGKLQASVRMLAANQSDLVKVCEKGILRKMKWN